jgi:hypothetical protein
MSPTSYQAAPPRVIDTTRLVDLLQLALLHFSYLGRLAVRPWSKLNLVAFGHLLESQGTGAYFRVTKSRGRGALRRERNCVSKDSGGEGAVELCVNCYRHA